MATWESIILSAEHVAMDTPAKIAWRDNSFALGKYKLIELFYCFELQ